MDRKTGIFYALGAAVLFGASTPLAKFALDASSPLLVAGLLYLGSGVGLALVRLAHRHSASDETPLGRSDLPWLAGAIAAGGIVAPALLLFGLLNMPASSASLLLNLEAVATAAIAWIIFKENVDKRVGAGFAAIFLGGVLLTIPSEGRVQLTYGALLIAAACVCWGIDNNLTRKISGSDPTQIAMWKGLIAGLVNTSFAFALGASLPSASLVLAVSAVGFFGYGVSLVMFVKALRFLGTARTGAYFSTAPFVGAALALFLGQGKLDWPLCVSGCLMLVGVWLHVSERHEHEHIHEELEHDHLHIHDEHHQHSHKKGEPPGEPHAHRHRHAWMRHRHAHYPDLHHRHHH